MAIFLRDSQYGKAETRVVRIRRETARHEIADLNVSTALRGDFAAAHVAGDQARVLPTDSQKNACFAYAKDHGTGEIEDYARALAGHFVDDIASVTRAQVAVDEYRWERVVVAGAGHAHAFVRAGHEIRTAAVTIDAAGPIRESWIISGLRDLVVLKSTGSQFTGFLRDRYTTLAEATDRVLATSLTARSRRCSRWARQCWRPGTTSPRSGCPRRTSTISSSISRPSAWRTPVRSSTPMTAPTA